MDFFVTAIGTDSGKTLVASILCEAFHADYWKPVQAGLPADGDQVRGWLSNSRSTIHEETYRFKTAVSPHAAAKIEGLVIERSRFKRPHTSIDLVVEGAGGCLVPLNDNDFMIDLALDLGAPVVLVSNLYLGSINHTLLTVEALRSRAVSVAGIIFNGTPNPESERIILNHSQYRVLLSIPTLEIIDKSVIRHYASLLRENWNGHETTF
jgi:dethiobiotin synthetase